MSQATPEKVVEKEAAVHPAENGNAAKSGPLKFINNKKATEAPVVVSKNIEKSQADVRFLYISKFLNKIHFYSVETQGGKGKRD